MKMFKKKQKKEKIEEQVAEPTTEPAADVIIETMVDGLCITDYEGRIIRVNDSFADMVGYKKKELRGKMISKIVFPEGKGRTINEIIENGITKNVEKTLLTKENKKIPVQLNAFVLRDHTNETNRIVGIFRDITELKKTMDDLEKTKKEREERIEELERMHKLMIGREKRIIELKDKIWELEKKLKEREGK